MYAYTGMTWYKGIWGLPGHFNFTPLYSVVNANLELVLIVQLSLLEFLGIDH